MRFPQGDALKNVKLSDTVSGQVPILVDVGGKVIPQLFIGGYFGLAFGGAAGALKAACDLDNQACVSVDLNLGVEAQYHFLPDGSTNPWLGYGLGFESLAVSAGRGADANGNIRDQTLGLGGFNFAASAAASTSASTAASASGRSSNTRSPNSRPNGSATRTSTRAAEPRATNGSASARASCFSPDRADVRDGEKALRRQEAEAAAMARSAPMRSASGGWE